MFVIRITPEAKVALLAELATSREPEPVIMVHREGAIADVVRTGCGGVKWAIERPHPWAVTTIGRAGVPEGELIYVDDLPVYRALLPKAGERGVEISVLDGRLYIDALA